MDKLPSERVAGCGTAGDDQATGPGAHSLVGVTDGETTLYERVGGQPWFDDLVERFYEGVEGDPLLRPLYPEDLGPGKRHLALFLGQYWGGPGDYSAERGHPRLRARHLPFTIGRAERDAWVRHMTVAVDGADMDLDDRALMVGYLEDAATFLVNQHPLSLRPS
jgi:hemoglobin